MKKYKIGYTQGVYDMFHIGHLNLLNNAKKMCEYLIVGINADELVKVYKNKTPVISEENRRLIVSNIKSVDKSIIVHTLDKVKIWKDLRYDAIFIGDDWKGNERWKSTKKELKALNVDVIFLPHTDGVSSTNLKKLGKNKIDENV